jgi:hypothetical protein
MARTSKNYHLGGGSLGDPTSHPDNGLPALPSLSLPGAGDDLAQEQYLLGKLPSLGSAPIGGAPADATQPLQGMVTQAPSRGTHKPGMVGRRGRSHKGY